MVINRRQALAGLGASAFALGLSAPAQGSVAVGFYDLFVTGSGLTDYARNLTGSSVEMTGFMAPPLKAEMAFFVLTITPMGICPFCDSEATWPEGIVAVHTGSGFRVERYDTPLVVRGTLDTGFHVDRETGFGSMIRLVDAHFTRFS